MRQMIIHTWYVVKRVVFDGSEKIVTELKKMSFSHFSIQLWNREEPRARDILPGPQRNR